LLPLQDKIAKVSVETPHEPLVVPIWKVFTNRGLALFAMWIIAILLYHRNALIARREETLTRIQLLEGRLPIFAD
jgi:hypothetical protein